MSELLDQLKFVQSAIAKRGEHEEFKHFKIEDKRITGTNSLFTISTPVAFDINCIPEGTPLIKAISKCKDTITMTMTKAGKLSIKSNSFRAYINCLEFDSSNIHYEAPEGNFYNIDGERFLNAIQTVFPFVADDKSPQPWAKGVLLSGSSALATNNAAIIEYWVGTPFPITCNIPKATVKELIRIGKPPVKMQATENNIGFFFDNGQWLRSQLLTTQWPDFERVLNRESNVEPFRAEIFDALPVLKPFVDSAGRVFFHENKITTSIQEGDGAVVEIDGIDYTGTYQIDSLMLLEGKANTIDFGNYPQPSLFFGDNLRGALVGMRE